MKVTTRKILAVMIAVSMIFQSGITAYAADAGIPTEKSEETAMTSEPVSDETVSDTGQEAKNEAVIEEVDPALEEANKEQFFWLSWIS